MRAHSRRSRDDGQWENGAYAEHRASINCPQEKEMTPPPKILSSICTALPESALLYGTVRRWCRKLKCGRTSCEDEHGGGPSKAVSTEETVETFCDVKMQEWTCDHQGCST